jgi:hypothetical protein
MPVKRFKPFAPYGARLELEDEMTIENATITHVFPNGSLGQVLYTVGDSERQRIVHCEARGLETCANFIGEPVTLRITDYGTLESIDPDPYISLEASQDALDRQN